MKIHLLNLSLIVSLVLYLLIHVESATNDTQKLALLYVKSHLTDDHADAFSSWNDSLHFCQWRGVQCGHKHRGMVVGLNLSGMNLYGEVSPFIGNLSFLRSLDLSRNFLGGIVPPELGHLNRLQNLNLSSNALSGSIPANLSSCTNLINVSLGSNALIHQIPPELGSLLFLERLSLNNNNLSGNFPPSFGNLSSLQELDMSYNNISGTIPETVRNLKKLTYLDIGLNQLSGMFPPALYNLSTLTHLGLTQSQFHGELRPDFGVLFPHIQTLWLSTNSLTGEIPLSLQNLSSLVQLDLSYNQFSGNIPSILGNLQNLSFLNLAGNSFGYAGDGDMQFLTSLANCSNLQMLDFGMNKIGGPLPSSVGNLSSNLAWLSMYSNHVAGSIPEEIAQLTGLTTLNLGDNLFTGNIPASIGTLANLQSLQLYENHLVGEIPFFVGNLSHLLEFYVFENSLEGNLPSSFENLKVLQDARFCHNKLNGTIPPQLIGLASLKLTLNLSHNSFTGPLPDEVGNLNFLTELDVSHNNLSGDIPSNLGLCISLTTLNIESNSFRGNIPDLSKLRGLQYLDLSENNLNGQIPEYMATFPDLMNLNLSYNEFEGEVPAVGIFINETAIQLNGNAKLCGTPQSNLQPCHVKRRRRRVNLRMIIPIIAVSFCLLLSLPLFFLSRKKTSTGKNRSKASFGRVYPKISFKELYSSTAGFSSNNLIGAGSFGTVYVGVVGDGELPIAVKVLKLQQHGASRSFLAECEALRNTRHRNLVKVISVCSAVDNKGNDFKAFIYPFMSNGSLEKWLHPKDDMSFGTSLNFSQKINIAIDIASAMRYLHHQSQTPIVHCDLKPSNVLLDSDFTAYVSDFGLARVLSKLNGQTDLDQFSSLGIKGTIGYTAPEYGLGSPVSIQGDVYSYGVLLLELFTGRSPVDEAFKDGLNLQNFVKLALVDVVLEIIDHQLTGLEENIKSVHGSYMNKELMNDCLVSVLKIAIECTSEIPHARISMEQVVQGLVSVKEKFPGMLDDNIKAPKKQEGTGV